jgi:hypothetical protein
MRKGAVLAAGFMAFVVLAGVGIFTVVRMLGDVQLPLPIPSAYQCKVGPGPDDQVKLSAGQAANAATIAAVGIRRGVPKQAIVVALATAWQESDLENLSGGDRDSIGLFQQRPSQGWGTAEQIADPRYAAGRFYSALLKVKGWQEMRVTDAAQAVQRSAYPEAYEDHAADSDVVATALIGDAGGSVGCTVEDDPAERGPAAAQALIQGLRLDWGDSTGKLDANSVAVTVKNEKSGWQYAHWLVAHATERGVTQVTFGANQWTAESGTWTRASAESAPGTVVVADVHA